MSERKWRLTVAGPTREMIEALDGMHADPYLARGRGVDCWTSMLQASPSPLEDKELVEGIAELVMKFEGDSADALARAVLAYLSGGKEG